MLQLFSLDNWAQVNAAASVPVDNWAQVNADASVSVDNWAQVSADASVMLRGGSEGSQYCALGRGRLSYLQGL